MCHRFCDPPDSSLTWCGFGICLTAVLLLAGCAATSPNGFYPMGMFGVASTNELPQLREVGFTLVNGSADRTFLRAANQAGLKVLATLGTEAGPAFNETVARRTVRSFDRHPALWAWFLVDEPDLHQIAPGDIDRANRLVKSVPARKPTAVTLSSAMPANYYAPLADIAIIDRYPIGWLPLANLGQHVRLMRLAAGKNHSVIAAIQAFDWRNYPELMPNEEGLRPPTYMELRCMTFLALAMGADGLFYYAYDDGRWKMSEHPRTWGALRKVVSEVNQSLPLFQGKHLWRPYRHEFKDWAHRFNPALESSITPAFLHVERGNQRIPAGDYLLAINNTDRPHDYRIHLPELREVQVPVVDELRKLPTPLGWLADHFEPFEVHIYGPMGFAKSGR
jgi:hypothetical protein